MAISDDLLGLTELTKINGADLADIDVSDLLDDAPFLDALGAVEASNGDIHKYLKETGAPVVGFRAINDGRNLDHSEDTAVTVTLKVLDATSQLDVAFANGYTKGKDAAIARAVMRHLKAAYAAAESQIIYGTGSDAAGFAGLADNAGYDKQNDAMVYDGGGTTADIGSSVWLIRTGIDDMMAVGGNGGNVEVEETTIVKANGSANGTYPAFYTPATGWLGMQIGSAYSVARICNLTTEANCTLTDDMIYEALALFPASRQPNMIVCNRRSLKQLRASRTATNGTGTPAPRPTEVEGIPIIVTDSIVSTEALLVDA